MLVVCHADKCMQHLVVGSDGAFEPLHTTLAIRIIPHEVTLLITAGDDVIDRARELDAQSPHHREIIGGRCRSARLFTIQDLTLSSAPPWLHCPSDEAELEILAYDPLHAKVAGALVDIDHTLTGPK